MMMKLRWWGKFSIPSIDRSWTEVEQEEQDDDDDDEKAETLKTKTFLFKFPNAVEFEIPFIHV